MSATTAGVLGFILGAVLATLVLVLSLRGRRRPDPGSAAQRRPATPALAPETAELLEMLRSITVVVDDSGQIVRASSSAAVLGLVRAEGLRHPELRAMVHQAQRTGTVQEHEFDLRRGLVGSARIHVAVRVAPLSNGHTVVLAEDLTHARRVEEVRRDFVVNVSHELKTPVGGLRLLAEAVEDAADDPEAVARFAGRMKREVTRLSKLVAEIINLSRLQTHESTTTPEFVDVFACAHEAVEHTRSVAQQRHITVSAISPHEQLSCYGDPELLVTAVRNLVANAIAYSDDRTRVSVVVRRQRELVEVSVSDQGTGIPLTERDRIFERFYRVDAARSRATGGTGLGLSIVKHICANHGGEVTVWSQEGQGSTFTMRLPAATDDLTAHTVSPPAPARSELDPPADDPSITSPTPDMPNPTDSGVATDPRPTSATIREVKR